MTNKQKKHMNQTEKLNPALLDLEIFTASISHHELEEELWENLLFAMGSHEADVWTPEQRCNRLYNYRILIQTSKALHTLFPAFKKRKVEIGIIEYKG